MQKKSHFCLKNCSVQPKKVSGYGIPSGRVRVNDSKYCNTFCVMKKSHACSYTHGRKSWNDIMGVVIRFHQHLPLHWPLSSVVDLNVSYSFFVRRLCPSRYVEYSGLSLLHSLRNTTSSVAARWEMCEIILASHSCLNSMTKCIWWITGRSLESVQLPWHIYCLIKPKCLPVIDRIWGRIWSIVLFTDVCMYVRCTRVRKGLGESTGVVSRCQVRR